MTDEWAGIVESLREDAQRMHGAREVGLGKCRTTIQLCAKCIRHIHRDQTEEARALLAQARESMESTREALRPFPELYYAGYLQDAEKELVEAGAVLAMVQGEAYPTRQELGVGLTPYLHGMGEAASEVRRYTLDSLRKGNTSKAEDLLTQMECIYDDLITFDFPDGMTGGLRRTTDALRAVIERTRSDLTTTAVQQQLIRELDATRKKLT